MEVFEWQPPFGDPGRMRAEIAGWITLTPEQSFDLCFWLEKVRAWEPLDAPDPVELYCLSEPERWQLDSVSGKRKWLRFSCASFVERAYAEGAHRPLVVDSAQWPAVSLDVLREIWGRDFERAGWTGHLPRFGLVGPAPWRILLPGYLLAATADEAQLPYTPQVDDAFAK